ncbi:hypothetical protein TNCV_2462761 [Trichonephila clavipes]|nr:hypothetical protein TNCV_2462761 [Trichonephila clavipes]
MDSFQVFSEFELLCRGEGLIHVKSARAQSPPVGVVWKLGERVAERVSSSSLVRGSNFRSSSPIALELLYSVLLIKHSELNSDAQQSMPRPTVPFSVFMTCRSFDRSDAEPPVFSFQASWVSIYQPTEGMKG